MFSSVEGLHVEAVSLQRTHGAARRVDCPRHGVLAVVHNVCFHHALQIGRNINKMATKMLKIALCLIYLLNKYSY